MKRSYLKAALVASVLVSILVLTWRTTAQISLDKVFVGVSENGSFDEALDNAIAAAHEGLCPNCADFRVHWQLQSVSGRNGGFVYTNEVTVVIEAH